MLRHVYCEASAKPFETTDDEVGYITSQAELTTRWSDRQLNSGLLTVGNDDLTDVATASHVRESSWDVSERE